MYVDRYGHRSETWTEWAKCSNKAGHSPSFAYPLRLWQERPIEKAQRQEIETLKTAIEDALEYLVRVNGDIEEEQPMREALRNALKGE